MGTVARLLAENVSFRCTSVDRIGIRGYIPGLNTTRAEFLATAATNDRVRLSSVRLGGIPLVVLSATQHEFPPELQADMEAMHRRLQEELATLSSQAVLRLAETDHNGLLANKQAAHTTAGSIEDVLEAVRSGTRLQQS